MITIRLCGGLGNQLFQIFSTIAYSIQQQQPCVFPHSTNLGNRSTYWDTLLKSIVGFTAANHKHKMTNESLAAIPMYREPEFNYRPLPKLNNQSINLHGYFQSYKYFEREYATIFSIMKISVQQSMVKSEHLYYFTPLNILNGTPVGRLTRDLKATLPTNELKGNSPMEDCSISNLHRCKQNENSVHTISMHFRLGDYKQLPDHHPVMPYHYYDNALQHILSKRQNGEPIRVLYFCEAEDDAIVYKMIRRLEQSNQSNIEFVKVDDAISDWKQMLLMSTCDDNIIANSSFSWWGAHLNANPDKIVCYPNVWFGQKLAHHDTSDLCPQSWSKIALL